MTIDDIRTLEEIATCLRRTPRLGQIVPRGEDKPEGIRVIQVSDMTANKWAEQLQAILDKARKRAK